MARINHPNVVRVFDSGWEEGLPYLALEWVEGGSLGEKLKGGPLPQNAVKRLARELLDGLTAVHEAGLLHRDIKPDNIMMARDGSAKLTDFSLAGLAHQSTLTGHDAIVGSPAYIAPELIDRKPPDKRSDLYGVGVVLYEALTGSNPFDMGEPMATLDRVRRGGAQKITGRGRIEPTLATLIDALLEPDPNKRPCDASEALMFLRGIQPVAPISVAAPVGINRSRRLMYPAIASLIAIGLIGLVLFLRQKQAITTIAKAPELSIRSAEPNVIAPEEKIVEEPSLTVDHAKSQQPQKDTIKIASSEANIESTVATPSSASVALEGYLQLVVQPWGNIELDGVDKGASPIGRMKLKSGSHQLRVTHPTLPTVNKEINIESNVSDTIRIDLRAEAAMLWISASPWGYLWIDGDSLGLLPRDGPIWLSPGKRFVKIEHTDYGKWSDSIEFKAGDKTEIKVNLQNGTMVATPKTGQ